MNCYIIGHSISDDKINYDIEFNTAAVFSSIAATITMYNIDVLKR